MLSRLEPPISIIHIRLSVDHTGNPFTMRYLADLMKVSEGRLVLDYQPDQGTGVEIYLGDDWAGDVP